MLPLDEWTRALLLLAPKIHPLPFPALLPLLLLLPCFSFQPPMLSQEKGVSLHLQSSSWNLYTSQGIHLNQSGC